MTRTWNFFIHFLYFPNSKAEDLLKSILNRGGVPNQPTQYVFREKEIQELKEGLSNLDNGEFLAIHGGAGSGKSVLGAEVLRNTEITLKYFPDGVFWFRVGMKDQEKLLNKLKILFEKLNAASVTGTNVTTVEFALELLRKQFLNDYKNSLLILDDVWSGATIKQFEIAAKVLVTTRDRTVMDVTSNPKVVTLASGFTMEETFKVKSHSTEKLEVRGQKAI